MSTRAVYTFIDNDNTYHIYKHHDGYPKGAAEWIENALTKAWPLPRFEACEFSAAFVAANKDGGGGTYLSTGYDDHGDLSYRYEISLAKNELYIKAFSANYDDTSRHDRSYHLIFEGNLSKFKQFKG